MWFCLFTDNKLLQLKLHRFLRADYNRQRKYSSKNESHLVVFMWSVIKYWRQRGFILWLDNFFENRLREIPYDLSLMVQRYDIEISLGRQKDDIFSSTRKYQRNKISFLFHTYTTSLIVWGLYILLKSFSQKAHNFNFRSTFFVGYNPWTCSCTSEINNSVSTYFYTVYMWFLCTFFSACRFSNTAKHGLFCWTLKGNLSRYKSKYSITLSNCLSPHGVIAAIKYKNKILCTTRLGTSFANRKKNCFCTLWSICKGRYRRKSTHKKVFIKLLQAHSRLSSNEGLSL